MKKNNNQHLQIITDSWQRCRDFGLQHDATPALEKLQSADTQDLLEAHRSLIQITDHAVLPYYDNILNNSPCLILLADSQGQVLNSWGERRFLSTAQNEWFNAGASWHEMSTGTNAIGTALTAGEAVQIQRDEHFLKLHRYMIGSASPIFDVDNELLGVLDISSDIYMPQAHTLGMVRLMSQSIENRLIIDKYHKTNYVLTFNTHYDNLDSQWSGLIVINLEGTIIAFNRRAELLLNHLLRGAHIEHILNCDLSKLQKHGKVSCFKLRMLDKYNLHAKLQEPNTVVAQPLLSVPKVNPNILSMDSELAFDKLQFGDLKIKKAIAQGQKVIEKDIPILIFGETGVGKEVFVKALHRFSVRRTKELVALNCAAIPADLVESELFGYVKGAFTGADSKGSVGLIRKADKGILFLDEIGDMPLNVQGRLLRVLQERKVTPLGSTKSYPVDVKLISATNCNLKTLVAQGHFRKDLFYRVSGLNIELPALKDRQDKQALFNSILSIKSLNPQQAKLAPDIMRLFLRHPWPGNIRQFISVLEVALAMAEEGKIEGWHLPDDFYDDLSIHTVDQPDSDIPYFGSSDNALLESNINPESSLIDEIGPKNSSVGVVCSEVMDTTKACYQQCDRNLSKTAKVLGVSRNTLYKRLRQLGLK